MTKQNLSTCACGDVCAQGNPEGGAERVGAPVGCDCGPSCLCGADCHCGQ